VLAGQLPVHHALDLAVETPLEARTVGTEQAGLPLAAFTVVCTGVQQPIWITLASALSLAGWMTRPSLGMIRTR